MKKTFNICAIVGNKKKYFIMNGRISGKIYGVIFSDNFANFSRIFMT